MLSAIAFFIPAVLPTLPTPNTGLVVEPCSTPDVLSSSQIEILTSRGFTKCCFGAFNVLVTGTSDYPDSYILTAAVTVANILDQDGDGVADDPAVLAELSFAQNANPPKLHGAPTQETEREGDFTGNGFVYSFSLQTWHYNDCESNANAMTWGGYDCQTFVRRVITEEVFHMVTQIGYSRAHPAALGMTDFTSSIACREMAAAECVYWHHPENECPNPGTHTPPPLEPATGTDGCNDAGCDCVEWIHQTVFILANQTPGLYGGGLQPTTRDALLPTLSSDFTEMLDDPAYHQISAPLPYSYSPAALPTIEASIHRGTSISTGMLVLILALAGIGLIMLILWLGGVFPCCPSPFCPKQKQAASSKDVTLEIPNAA